MSNNHQAFQGEKYHQFKFLSKEYRPEFAGALPGAQEDLASEIYNPGKETIRFTNIHPLKHRMYFFNLPPIFWEVIQCPPEEWAFLPHSMYEFWVPSGSKAYQVIRNYGDAMFKGNKLPSRPEEKKIRFFQTR